MRAPCWTCRSRTIQCDQSRTPCAKCEKAGLECLDKRPLRWVQGVAIRGKMRGRDPGKHHQVTDRQQPAQRKRNALSRTKSLTTNISPQFALQDPYVHHLDWSSRFYLDYYDLRISKLFILYDSERNPFRSLLTYALDDATLRMAILAVAARHFANSGHSFEQWNDALAHRFVNADWDALHFKMRAIKLLSSSLSCPGSSQKRTILLATILFMIFLDILESGIDGWQYHLHGAKSLVNLSRSLLEVGAKDNFSSCPDVVVEDTERFVGQQFALVSTIGGALSGSDDSTPDFFQFDENRHQESIIRSFLGCPGFLLRAIHFFSVQRHLVGSLQLHDDLTIYEHIRNTSTMPELTAKFNCHRRALESVQLRVPSEVQIEELTLLLQAFKIATMLYGNRILHAFKTHLGIITPDNHELVLQLLSTIDSLKSNATFFKCLLWPIFIVGLESQVASEHELVVEFLKRIWNLTCCVNVINASKILRDSWKHVHLGSSLAPGTAIPVIETGWLLV